MKMQKLIDIANQLATVRDWCVIPDETNAGINGVIDELNELIVEKRQDSDNYVIKEFDSKSSFAVLRNADLDFEDDLVSRTALAVKEEFSYEKTKLAKISTTGNLILLDFDCTLDGGEEEVREIELIKITIY